jgi:hypothetical protein
VLSENQGSEEEITYVATRRNKTKKPLPASKPAARRPASPSSEVVVVEQVDVDVEVDIQDLPQTGHFREDCHQQSGIKMQAGSVGSDSGKQSETDLYELIKQSQNLLEDDDSDHTVDPVKISEVVIVLQTYIIHSRMSNEPKKNMELVR